MVMQEYLVFECGTVNTPPWCYDWIKVQPWYAKVKEDDMELQQTGKESTYREQFANLTRLKHNLDVFEYKEDMMYIRIPDSIDTMIFLLKHQGVTKEESA